MGESSQSPIVITGPIEVEAITTHQTGHASGFVRISRYNPSEPDLRKILDAFWTQERIEFSIRNVKALKRADFGGYIQKANAAAVDYWLRFVKSGVIEFTFDVVVDGELKILNRKWPRKARVKAKAPKISNSEDIKSLARKFTP